MKKILSCALVLSMAFSLAGCGSKGGYASTEKKVISAAEECFGAEEASKKARKKILSDSFRANDAVFEDGAYTTLTSEDIEDMDIKESDFDPEDMPNMLVLVKSENNSYVETYVVEASDKDTAGEIYDYFTERFGTTEKKLKKEAKKFDAEYGFEEDDNKLAIIMVSEDRDKAQCAHIQLDGKVVSLSIYDGKYESDLLEEYYEFLRSAGYTDIEALLEE